MNLGRIWWLLDPAILFRVGVTKVYHARTGPRGVAHPFDSESLSRALEAGCLMRCRGLSIEVAGWCLQRCACHFVHGVGETPPFRKDCFRSAAVEAKAQAQNFSSPTKTP